MALYQGGDERDRSPGDCSLLRVAGSVQYEELRRVPGRDEKDGAGVQDHEDPQDIPSGPTHHRATDSWRHTEGLLQGAGPAGSGGHHGDAHFLRPHLRRGERRQPRRVHLDAGRAVLVHHHHDICGLRGHHTKVVSPLTSLNCKTDVD